MVTVQDVSIRTYRKVFSCDAPMFHNFELVSQCTSSLAGQALSNPTTSCLISESCHVHVRDAQCSPGAISDVANAVAELQSMGQEGKNQAKLYLLYKNSVLILTVAANV